MGNLATKTIILNSDEKKLLTFFQSARRRIIFFGSGLFGHFSMLYQLEIGYPSRLILFSTGYILRLPTNYFELIQTLFNCLIFISIILIIKRDDKRGIQDLFGNSVVINEKVP